ncbi:MAG: sulfur oxidation c-type cytochrome SoxA [Gammaproteobacteria bacterium]|nr:MAG: sulfur oxidation c-type cytochrome SoxA [Gammaproteobacteria bacterium]
MEDNKMKNTLLAAMSLMLLGGGITSVIAASDPEADLKTYKEYFKQKFPDYTAENWGLGMYNFNADKRSQWESIMEFPPYETVVEEGEALFNKPFKNGKTYASCLENGGIGISHTYPRFDAKSGKVRTLSMEINDCRKKNGEEPLKLLKGKLPTILAYMAETSRGKIIDIKVPDDPRALAAYEDGKRIYFTRRGPRGFACFNCHWETAGTRIRGNELSPARGQAGNFPSYRSKWGAMGPIQRRYKGCQKNVGAKPLKAGGEAMNNLEYFHRRLSNGLPSNAPNNRF